MCYLIKTFSGWRGAQKRAGRVYFSHEFIIFTLTRQLLKQMCGKIKEGRVKSKKALTSSRNFISCTVGARRKRGREGKRRESEGET